VPSESTLKKLLTGSATKLSSQFRLSYNMILNLIRASDLSVEDMIKRSFSEFHAQKALSSHDLAKVSKVALCRVAPGSVALSPWCAVCVDHIILPFPLLSLHSP
jgi:hypothetical protein